jgi:formylmethanofuran dehydrogenase subunit D
MPEKFVLIPGRSTEQGTSVGDKSSEQYVDVTRTLRMNPDDMTRLGLTNGARVRLRSAVDEISVTCVSAKDELPPGLLFIAYGPESSRLMGGETQGTGMPDSKGLEVELRCE